MRPIPKNGLRMSSVDFERLNQSLLNNASYYVPAWLPGGKLVGYEYTCGSLTGGNGGSCKVNITSGKWADFADDNKGGDLVSLYAAINSLSQVEAAKILLVEMGEKLPEVKNPYPHLEKPSEQEDHLLIS